MDVGMTMGMDMDTRAQKKHVKVNVRMDGSEIHFSRITSSVVGMRMGYEWIGLEVRKTNISRCAIKIYIKINKLENATTCFWLGGENINLVRTQKSYYFFYNIN